MLLTRCVRCLTCKGKRKSKYKARLLYFSVFTNYMYVIESSSTRLLEHFKIVYLKNYMGFCSSYKLHYLKQ